MVNRNPKKKRKKSNKNEQIEVMRDRRKTVQ